MTVSDEVSIRAVCEIARDAVTEGRGEDADKIMEPVRPRVREVARQQARTNVGFRLELSREERATYVLQFRDTDERPGPEDEFLEDLGHQEIANALGIAVDDYRLIEDVWRREYREQYMQAVAESVEQLDPDADGWIPTTATAPGRCHFSWCGADYEQGTEILVARDGRVIHASCWEEWVDKLEMDFDDFDH